MKNWFVVLSTLIVVFSGAAYAQALGATTNPVSGTYAYGLGSPLIFTVTATGGTGPYTYKWAKDSTASYLPGETSSILTIDPVTTGDAGTYYAEVTDSVPDMITTDPIVISIMTIPINPVSGTYTYDPGSSFTFTVTATDGIEPYSYQWTKDTEDIVDATTSVLTIDPVTPDTAGVYTVLVNDAETAAIESEPIIVEVASILSIYADEPTIKGFDLTSGLTTLYPTVDYFITNAKKNNTFLYVVVTTAPATLDFQWVTSRVVTKKIVYTPYTVNLAVGTWLLGPLPKEVVNTNDVITFKKPSTGDTTVIKSFVVSQ